MLSLVFGYITAWLLLWHPPSVPSIDHAAMDFHCPTLRGHKEICVFHDHERLVVVNPTNKPIFLSLQVERVENLKLNYRFPFYDEVPARSSKVLLSYRLIKPEMPYALDYDWKWR